MIDARWINLGGLGTYTYNLINRFHGCSTEFVLGAIASPAGVQKVEPFCDRVLISSAEMYTAREQVEIPLLARGADLLHVPHYNAPLLHRGPLIVSILDLIHLIDPTYRKKAASRLYAKPMMKLAAHKSRHVITLSEYSKMTLVERLGISNAKISVVYCGVSPEFVPEVKDVARRRIAEHLGVDSPYVLYVGNLKPHKNVPTLIQAVSKLRNRCSIPLKLVIVGDDPHWGAARREECVTAGIAESTIFVKSVAQELLPAVYSAAQVLVMPSTLEGFGLPVLEAMACGTPVVTSNAASLPEVGGDAVVYFDPYSLDELVSAIERVLSSTDLQRSLIAKGLERARMFDWNECVKSHLAIYRHVLGMN